MGGEPASEPQSQQPSKLLRIEPSIEHGQVKFDEAKSAIAMVTIRAPEFQGMESRAPIDLVTVIDVSGSMSGLKIALVKETLEFITTQLSSEDRLSIVTFSDEAKEALPLTRMDETGKANARAAIGLMRATGCTNLSGGLAVGLSQLKNRQDKLEVSSVLLLTDGEANRGYTKAPEIIDNVIMTRTSADDPTIRTNAVDCSIHCFGFGSDHNAALLRSITEAGHGSYFFIERQDSIAEAFVDCIGGLLSVAAKNICLKLRVAEDIKIKQVLTTRYPCTFDTPHREATIRIRDLQSEERRDILFMLDIPALPEEHAAPMDIGQITLTYENLVNPEEAGTVVTLSGAFSITRPAVITGSQVVNAEIDKQRNRVIAASAMEQASRRGDSGSLAEARTSIQKAIDHIVKSPTHADAFCVNLQRDLNRALEGLEDMRSYQEYGSHRLHSNYSAHSEQRSTDARWGAQAEYQTSSRAYMRAKWAKR